MPPPRPPHVPFLRPPFEYFSRHGFFLPLDFDKVLGQGGSMKYKENLNSRFLMQNIYRLYQK